MSKIKTKILLIKSTVRNKTIRIIIIWIEKKLNISSKKSFKKTSSSSIKLMTTSFKITNSFFLHSNTRKEEIPIERTIM